MQKIDDPVELSVFATNKCNFGCWFCRRTVDPGMDRKLEMKVETLEVTLRRYPSIRSVCIAGFGEPLLHSNVRGLIDFLKSRGLFVSLVTNGSLVLDNKDVFLGAGLDRVSVSLNASGQLPYERTHSTSLSFGRTVSAINWLSGEVGCRVIVSFVVHKDNYRQIPLMMALGLNCDGIDLYNVLPHGEANYGKIITVADKDVLDEIDSYKSLPGAARVVNWPKPVGLPESVGKCQLSFYHMLLSPDGYVSCCARVVPPMNVEGACSIFDEEDPWRSSFCNAVRTSTTTRKECIHCFGNY